MRKLTEQQFSTKSILFSVVIQRINFKDLEFSTNI